MANLIAQEPLTTQEQTVLTALIDGLYAEPGFSDVDAHDLAAATKISTRSIRGVLSSLIKKDYINIDDPGTGYQIVYLNESKYYLHPEWREDVPYWNNPEKKTYAELYA